MGMAARPVRSLGYDPTARPANVPVWKLAAHTSSSSVKPLANRRNVGSHSERPHHTWVSSVWAKMRVVSPLTFSASRRLRHVSRKLSLSPFTSQSMGPSGVS